MVRAIEVTKHIISLVDRFEKAVETHVDDLCGGADVRIGARLKKERDDAKAKLIDAIKRMR